MAKTGSTLEKSEQDRRGGVRADRVLAVKHRLVKRGTQKSPSVWSLSTTKNMSVSGLLFLSPVEYHKGDQLEVDIVMSGLIAVYNGKAEVVRVREASSHSFDVAVTYVEPVKRKRSAQSYSKKKVAVKKR